jgi:hypothetical protein
VVHRFQIQNGLLALTYTAFETRTHFHFRTIYAVSAATLRNNLHVMYIHTVWSRIET